MRIKVISKVQFKLKVSSEKHAISIIVQMLLVGRNFCGRKLDSMRARFKICEYEFIWNKFLIRSLYRALQLFFSKCQFHSVKNKNKSTRREVFIQNIHSKLYYGDHAIIFTRFMKGGWLWRDICRIAFREIVSKL